MLEQDCSVLRYYATSSGNFVPTFRVSLSKYVSGLGPIGCAETPVRIHTSSLCNNPEQLISGDIEFTHIYFFLLFIYLFIYLCF
jgi:hypothetical protein